MRVHLPLLAFAAVVALTWWMGRLRCGTWAWWRNDKETT